MKPITERSGLQGSFKPLHASGVGRTKTIRRLVRRGFSTTAGAPQQPSSLRRPEDDEINGSNTDACNILPAIIHECDGRNDKVHIHCKICTVTCDTEEDERDFKFHLGGPPSSQREDLGQFSRLFTIASHQGNGNRFEIRSKPFICGGVKWQPPLFSGKSWIKRIRRDDGKITIFINADLYLNVNRALNHQRKKLANQSPDAIFANHGPVKKGLCGGDNLAPLVLRPGEHDNARSRYIKQIMNALRSDVRRAARVSEGAGSEGIVVTGGPSDFSLRYLETCWDVGGAGFDACRALESITPAVREWGGRETCEGNRGSITTHFSDSEWLAVYAKTSDRLRFEIRHRPTCGKKSYTAKSITGIIAKMDEFRSMAARRINSLLGPLRARLAAPRSQQAWESFVLDWGACCGNTEASKAILGILQRENRILGGKYIECIPRGEKLLRKARDAGLVHHEHGAYRPNIGSEGNALTSSDNPASFPGHDNETQSDASVPKSPTPIRIVRERRGIPPSPPSDWHAVPPRLVRVP